jgi:hypothetical protein
MIMEDKDIKLELEREIKEVQKIIKSLSLNKARNYDARIDFATKIFQLAASSNAEARKFVNKCMSFANFYGDDQMISEEEWRKLNNSEEDLKETLSKNERYRNYFNSY